MSVMSMPLWRVLELTRDPGNGAKIGLDSYPIFDEKEREGLNRKIIDHFYLRDIGQETISIFSFMMSRTMHEIMPTYNQLYLSERIKFDPLATYNLETIRSGQSDEKIKRDSSTKSDTESGAESRSVNFDTPQTALARNKDYASSGADAASKSTAKGANTASDNSDATTKNTDSSTTKGYQGSAADLLTKFRSTILNIDLMILNDPELTSMFMGVWDNGAEIAPPYGKALY